MYFVAVAGSNVTKVTPVVRDYLLNVRTYMQLIAENSGGQMLFANTVTELAPLYAQIGRSFGTSYSLGFIPMASGSAVGYQHISVKATRPGVRVTQSRDAYNPQ